MELQKIYTTEPEWIGFDPAAGTLTPEQIDHALDQIHNRKAVLIESSGGPRNWRRGYAVAIDRRYYWFPRGTTSYFRMPSFIRSEEDALEFIQSAEPWYAAGVNTGVEYAQQRLRDWVNRQMLNEL